jgi:hypothetical protein
LVKTTRTSKKAGIQENRFMEIFGFHRPEGVKSRGLSKEAEYWTLFIFSRHLI